MNLAVLLLLPLLGTLGVILAPAKQAKWVSLATSLMTFVVSIILAGMFDGWGESAAFGLTSSWPILESFGLNFSLGVDSVAMMLILLTTSLVPLCIWGSFTAVSTRLKEYYGWLLVLETAMIGVFVARDLILFYIVLDQ